MKCKEIHYFLAGMAVLALGCASAMRTRTGLRNEATAALKVLCERVQVAQLLQPKAKVILVFPAVYRAGLLVGGQSGNGVALRSDGTPADYLNITSVSYGLQAGAQKFSYALFVMTDEAIEYMKKTGGWEIGTGPTVVLVDQGMASATTTTTLNKDVYAFIFSQQGLMAGLGLQGSKITRIDPAP